MIQQSTYLKESQSVYHQRDAFFFSFEYQAQAGEYQHPRTHS